MPQFDTKDPNHKMLVTIAQDCEEKVRGLVPDLKGTFRDLRGPHAIGRARSAVREALKDELAEIDAIVKAILKEKA